NEALVTNSKHHRSPYISTTFMRFPWVHNSCTVVWSIVVDASKFRHYSLYHARYTGKSTHGSQKNYEHPR
ncbi:hypothetical protein V5G97_15550, partial [Vibrio cholerae]|uniref:hypothetical protein n=1 Tax=Vibrio cholerae TaxID=666 RepID=UPI00396741C9